MALTLDYITPQHARITLNRPEKRNAFDDVLIGKLLQTFQTLADDKALRVIELAASGKHFSAGADLNWMQHQGQQPYETNRNGALELATLLQQIDRQPQVVIARVQGAAFGGALGLICAAHIAVARDDARFCLSEVRLGLLPSVISPYVVRALGARQARRYITTGELIEANTAKSLGLVHEVASEDEVDAIISTLVSAILKGAPQAQLEVPALIERVNQPLIDQAMIDHTAHSIASRRKSEEGQEGMAAFLEKRSASWIAHQNGHSHEN